MRPLFRILADDKDITAAVNDRLLDLSVSDEAGIKSDKLTLTLDDRPRPDGAMAALPRMGTKLAVSLGYAETGLVDMGRYIVDSLNLSNAPATLKVTAHAADMVGPFRSPKTRSWDATTLGAMVETIAGEHGYTPRVDPQLATIAVPHMDQRAESDMALLTRLAEQHDATAKPVNGSLILARQGAAVSAGGQPLAPVTLYAREITSWEYRLESRSPGGKGGESGEKEGKGGYRAEWWDYQAGITRTVTVGKEPFEDIRERFDTEARAKAAASARFNKGQRREKQLTLTLPGNPLIAAEHRLQLPDLRPNLPTDWRVTKAEHSMAGKGYVTRAECEQFLG